MKRSSERILTTHAGSLPRPADLVSLVAARAAGEAIDAQAYARRLRQAVGDIVRKQADLGIDVVDDGEFGKPSFVSYAQDRLAGYELKKGGERRNPWLSSREAQSFPEFYQANAASVSASHAHLVCTGPLAYRGEKLLQTDLDNLKAAMAETKVTEAFVPSVSPATVEDWNRNEYYKSAEDYVFAIAEAMRVEYRAIVDAGFLLQVDDPRLLTYYIMHPEKSVADCRTWAKLRAQALNHAPADIPREKIRYHTCYGINIGPRIHDLELKDIVDIMLGIKAGGYSFEASNPRHEHEWRV